jgi:hypothetical protein
MTRTVRVASVVLLAFALGGCAGGATTTASVPQPSGVVVAAEGGSDVGNDRPHVTYDGLMVRRRVVIAINPNEGADLGSLRKEMDRAAGRLHLTLSTVSPDVLDPTLLESLAPELAVALPAGATLAEAGSLIDPALGQAQRFPEVKGYDVASVLVHDLRFTARSANPPALARAVAREGILSDALGNYTTTLGSHEVEFTYTGPLLSDDLVESVRSGIARGANVAPAAVTVSPRSTSGVGVDMAKEPAQAPVVFEVSTAHHHGSGLPTVGGSSYASPWFVLSVALVVLPFLTLVLSTLVLTITRRTDREEEG